VLVHAVEANDHQLNVRIIELLDVVEITNTMH
jgi:hypothetical protein